MSKGTKYPQGNNRFKSSIDGLYYNGYLGSPEAAEDAYGECFRKIAQEIEKDLREGLTEEEFQILVLHAKEEYERSK